MNIGDHFAYIGGSFKISPKNLNRAIAITKKELSESRERLHLWKRNPHHESFAHDMKYHGAWIINELLNNHVAHAQTRIRQLKSLYGSQLRLDF